MEIVEPLGGSAFTTTPLGTDVADEAPRLFLAVTRTRSVVPSSADVSLYVFSVAPLMVAQLPPVRSQRRQTYVNAIGCAPTQTPAFAVSVCPTCGVPEIVGGLVFRGAPAAWVDLTTFVGSDVAVADPSAFVAVTRTRIRWPTSAGRKK